MLPVPADFPQSPIRKYDIYAPPVNGGFHLHPQCQQFGHAIVVKVANNAAAFANQNSARMFCYNLLSSNNWHNQEFMDVCTLTGDLIALFYNREPTRTIEQYLDNAVDSALRLKTSQYVYNLPELQQICGPEICRSSFDNVPVLNEMIQAIQHMYRQGNQQQLTMNPGMPISRQQTGAIPSFYGQQSSGFQFGVQNTGPSLTDLQTQRFASRNTQTAPVNEQQYRHQEPVITKPFTLVSEPMEMSENNIAVEFSNETYPAGNVVKSEIKKEEQVVPVTTNLESVVICDEKVSVEEVSIKDSEDTTDSDYEPLLDDTLESLILTCKSVFASKTLNTGNDRFQTTFGYAANTYFSSESYAESEERWKSIKSFSGLAKCFNGEISTLSGSDRNSNYFVPKDLEQYMGLMSMITNVFTKAINDFVKYRLELGVRIDSFMTDIDDLVLYIKQKSELKLEYFLEWEKYFLNGFSLRIDRNDLPCSVPDDVHVFAVSVFNTVTCVKNITLKSILKTPLSVGESCTIALSEDDVLWEIYRKFKTSMRSFLNLYPENFYVMGNNERVQVFFFSDDKYKVTFVRV